MTSGRCCYEPYYSYYLQCYFHYSPYSWSVICTDRKSLFIKEFSPEPLNKSLYLPNELDTLNKIHFDFLGIGYSAVELSNDILPGRPCGATGILYRKSFAQYICKVDTYDPRITAVSFNSEIGLILMICVYMPTDYGTYDSYEQYADTCAKIFALYDDYEGCKCCAVWRL